MQTGYSLVTFAIFIVVLIGVVKAIRVVPQQKAWVVERLGRFHARARSRGSTSSSRSSIASRTGTTCAKSRSTCRRRSASPRTTRSCRSTASCTSR